MKTTQIKNISQNELLIKNHFHSNTNLEGNDVVIYFHLDFKFHRNIPENTRVNDEKHTEINGCKK